MRVAPGGRVLRTLLAVGEHLNFTRAADDLGLTPAAVSYQIKEIEEQVGVQLFIRTSRSVRPTEAGTILCEGRSIATPDPSRVGVVFQEASLFPWLTAVENVGRNDPCPCGSGKKYKKCHGAEV